MHKQISPEALFNTLKLLFPTLTSVTKDQWEDFCNSEFPFSEEIIDVDWGDDYEYPSDLYRAAEFGDILNCPIPAQFCDNIDNPIWRDGQLTGAINTGEVHWFDEDQYTWSYCRVLVENGFPISTFPKRNYDTHLLFMGGKWIEGSKSRHDPVFYSDGETMSWDEENQPTRWKPLPVNE